MTPACTHCGDRVPPPRVVCDHCLAVIGKIWRAGARVALRFDVIEPVTAGDLAMIQAAIGEALEPWSLIPKAYLGRRASVDVIELEGWQAAPLRRRWGSVIIVKRNPAVAR